MFVRVSSAGFSGFDGLLIAGSAMMLVGQSVSAFFVCAVATLLALLLCCSAYRNVRVGIVAWSGVPPAYVPSVIGLILILFVASTLSFVVGIGLVVAVPSCRLVLSIGYSPSPSLRKESR